MIPSHQTQRKHRDEGKRAVLVDNLDAIAKFVEEYGDFVASQMLRPNKLDRVELN
jgi:hypothetical protein